MYSYKWSWLTVVELSIRIKHYMHRITLIPGIDHLLCRKVLLALLEESHTIIRDQVRKVVPIVVIVVSNLLPVKVECVVVETWVLHEPHPLTPAGRDVGAVVLVQILPKESWEIEFVYVKYQFKSMTLKHNFTRTTNFLLKSNRQVLNFEWLLTYENQNVTV